MRPETEKFLATSTALIMQNSKFGCFVRGREFQVTAVEELQTKLKEARELKLKQVVWRAESDANLILAFEFIFTALIEELQFYIALKEDRIDDAWNLLVAAQISAQSALSSHDVATGLNVAGFFKKLIALEKLLFPQVLFASCGLIVKESRCSICEEDYDTCDHIKGKPYWGELCSRIITAQELLEVSLVRNPANKACRATVISDENNIARDPFTWREISPFSGDGEA